MTNRSFRIALGLSISLASCIQINSQIAGRGTGTCSQLINGKYYQVPCSLPPSNPGGNTAGAELGAAIGTALGQAIGEALGRLLFGNPEEEAALRRRLQELEQRRLFEAQERARADAARLADVFRRLNAELKLAGLPQLTLKDSGNAAKLALKDQDSINKGSRDLKLKIGEQQAGYGIPGLPGIYTGGPRPAMSPSPPPQETEKASDQLQLKLGETESSGYGIPGLPGIHLGGPRPGASVFGNGIPGLPGIHLSRASGSLNTAKQLAGSAEKLSGPDKALAENAAIDAAVEDPNVQLGDDLKSVELRRTLNEYSSAKAEEITAGEDLARAQNRAETSRAVVEVARKQLEQQKLEGLDPVVVEQRRQDLAQIIAGAKSDEDASKAARQQFETAATKVTMARAKAVAAVRGAPTFEPTTSAALPASTRNFFKELSEKLRKSVAENQPSLVEWINALPPIQSPPDTIPEQQLAILKATYSEFVEGRRRFLVEIQNFEKRCPPGQVTPSADCVLERKEAEEVIAQFHKAIEEFNDSVVNAEVFAYTISFIKTAAWSDKERERLFKALDELTLPGPRRKWEASMDVVWRNVSARNAAEFEAEANKVRPSPMVGAGTQSFKDCAIFALANASGTPYGVVASRATELMRNGSWRKGGDPQKLIEEEGLMGNEVLLTAEALGTVEVVTPNDFRRILDGGVPVMVSVFARGGGSHQIALMRTFELKGETWYEMIDSNAGPIGRSYLNHLELTKILNENGIVYRPDEKTIPRDLK